MTKSATIAASPGHAGDVTRFPSTTVLSASTSTYVPPARFMSGPTAAYAVAFLPLEKFSAVRFWGAWDIAAPGVLVL